MRQQAAPSEPTGSARTRRTRLLAITRGRGRGRKPKRAGKMRVFHANVLCAARHAGKFVMRWENGVQKCAPTPGRNVKPSRLVECRPVAVT